MTQFADRFGLISLTIGVLLGLTACGYEYVPTPRPHGYPRVEIPDASARVYRTFASPQCPFRFEYPTTGEITRQETDSCWVTIRFPQYDLTWHLTHRDIPASGKDKAAHFEEYRKLIYKHSKKASRIAENPFQQPNGQGFFFEVYGEVGTPAQVFFADPSDNELLMMSFYYRDATARDSLRPITEYMKEELSHALATLKWERKKM